MEEAGRTGRKSNPDLTHRVTVVCVGEINGGYLYHGTGTMYRTGLFHSESVFAKNSPWLNQQLAEVVSLTALTPHTTELVLRPIESPLPVQTRPVDLAHCRSETTPIESGYSLAEPPTSKGHLTLVFDHVPGGQGSGYLSSLKPRRSSPSRGPMVISCCQSRKCTFAVDRSLFRPCPTALHDPRTGRAEDVARDHLIATPHRQRTTLP